MSGKLRLNGATSGYSELQAPDVAGDQTFTLPAVGASLVGYQQGLWVPTVTFSTNSNPDTTNDGSWERIGNLVHLYGKVRIDNLGTSRGSFIFEGVPYATYRLLGSTAISAAGTVSYMDYSSGIDYFPGITLNESSKMTLYKVGGSSLTDSNVGQDFSIRFSLSYRTDDTTWVPINGATIT